MRVRGIFVFFVCLRLGWPILYIHACIDTHPGRRGLRVCLSGVPSKERTCNGDRMVVRYAGLVYRIRSSPGVVVGETCPAPWLPVKLVVETSASRLHAEFQAGSGRTIFVGRSVPRSSAETLRLPENNLVVFENHGRWEGGWEGTVTERGEKWRMEGTP